MDGTLPDLFFRSVVESGIRTRRLLFIAYTNSVYARKDWKFHSLLHSVAGAKGLFFFHYPDVNVKNTKLKSKYLRANLLTMNPQALLTIVEKPLFAEDFECSLSLKTQHV